MDDKAAIGIHSMEQNRSDESEMVEGSLEKGESRQTEEAMETDSVCYCGKGRNLGAVELQCSVCMKWYHADCIGCYLGQCIPFMTNYQFSCKMCGQNGLESFVRKQAGFPQICCTAIANLMCQARTRGDNDVSFCKDKDIIPYIDKQWENLTTMARRIKLTWHTTVAKTLSKEDGLFVCTDDNGSDQYFSLIIPDLEKIGPNYDPLKSFQALQPAVKTNIAPEGTGKGRGAKRKAPLESSQPGYKLKRSDIGPSTKVAVHGYPLEHPYNKDGYRYILAESDPHAPNRQAFDESVDWAGKPIPGYLYRTYLGTEVLLSLNDRAPQLKISDDRLSVTGEKGYSMVRATHGVRRGSWYYEIIVEEMPADTACRVGWSLSLGNLQAPCGYDKFSFSWRSRKGTRFHQSRGKHYAEQGYAEGDVLGFMIHLPEPHAVKKLIPDTFKDRPLVKFKSHLYYEEKDHVSETEKKLKPSRGSQMIMYKNGVSQGVAFEDVFDGIYYPALSLYKNCRVRMNFGPDFKCIPQGLKDYRPMSDAASQTMIEYALADIIYHVENEGKLPEF
ncbi:set1/Ash2 histone methyltransferase complex subunit ASH2-like isoform X1 [Mytilus californianus]|uniref:set1/Ash2 histone methyltransferase complex subunit ASH2-like isoform X1 n=2 Tax=Mytilus californianus TaxID=6549 RepID=UPI002245B2BD|nr:set1/Ash2 histone methyltransferase complex subunit ASH2-like isoform X1 [Mytilus californianus]